MRTTLYVLLDGLKCRLHGHAWAPFAIGPALTVDGCARGHCGALRRRLRTDAEADDFDLSHGDDEPDTYQEDDDPRL